MMVHVSPNEEDVAETACSVTFAKRARAVECTRELSEELKKQKEKRISELEDEMKEAEMESEKLQKQIRKAEFLLSENQRILSTTCQNPEEEVRIPQGPKDHFDEVLETPKESAKAVRKIAANSLPRFMDSTVASRQRKSTAEKEISGKVRSFRSETRSSIQISGSQSNSYSGLKAILKNSNKRPRYGEFKNSLSEDPKLNSLESNPRPSSRGTMVATSESNLRVALCRHRRRMSDFM